MAGKILEGRRTTRSFSRARRDQDGKMKNELPSEEVTERLQRRPFVISKDQTVKVYNIHKAVNLGKEAL